MSNTKFTPGPYMVERIKKGEYYVKGEGSRLCLIDWLEHHDTEARANADLFAAAPDLYYALSNCADMLTEAAKQFRKRGDTGHATLCLMHAGKANKSLAKARGEKTDEK